ncbi:hypothetical protein [Pseudomonas viridiflava]|uniref:hypothetical protein n=1 Tax=Pseudomonas viridiflava TaxID=33069 RepID=UPI000EFBBC89|nr:hypothetical protein [Pseudomonas viridiflava]
MAYGLMLDFLFDVGDGVGEFLHDEEKLVFRPLGLDAIVKEYVAERNMLNAFFLKRQIKSYISNHMTPQGLEYVDPPFNQDTSFVEDYFEEDLHEFLKKVMCLLDREMEDWRRKVLSRLTGR